MKPDGTDILDDLGGSANPFMPIPGPQVPISGNTANNKITADTNYIPPVPPQPVSQEELAQMSASKAPAMQPPQPVSQEEIAQMSAPQPVSQEELAQMSGQAINPPQPVTDAELAQLSGQSTGQSTPSHSNPLVDTAMSVLKAIKGAPLSLPAKIPHYWGDAVQSITGQPWMPDVVKSYGKAYNTIAQLPTLAGHNLGMTEAPQENQQSLTEANQNFGPAAPYVTGFAHGFLNGYVPETETKHGTWENAGQEVADLLGMAMNVQGMSTKAVASALERIAPGALNKIWGSAAKLLGTGGLSYGAYSAQSPTADYNPQQPLIPQTKDYLEQHLWAGLKGAVLGKLFAIGGSVANGAIKKLLPSAPEWLAGTIG
ncbi:MAG: hypothetical protein HQK96_18235 [Nitrospirae bacterium]|nr:hypothetical protein [Nitrospirota bacterium]